LSVEPKRFRNKTALSRGRAVREHASWARGSAQQPLDLVKTRPRGRAPKGKRLLASVPHSHWKTTTFLAALRPTGLTAPLVVDGAINGDIFLSWVRHHRVPTLHPDDVVVMDNLGAHKVAGVREAITAAGTRVV
jgi:hypothetical protein